MRRERYSGSYSRSFGISGIDTNNISAEYNDGILKIELPKKAEEKNTRRLEIK
ncbi:MAG: Hsp20 family protein [Oscillospiraceae bacterium]|nr:Hsp20 family protein [Oscillospiraceae bacterium]